MAAPTPTNRQTPNGRKLGDGYQVLITNALDPDIAIWEEEVTPPGVDGGDSVDTSSQLNTVWRTKAPGSLVEMTDSTAKVFYDPATIVGIAAIINKSTVVTWTNPDGSQLCAYAYFKSFIPGPMSRGNKPDATLTIVITNQDPVTCVEEGPVFIPGAGTGTSTPVC